MSDPITFTLPEIGRPLTLSEQAELLLAAAKAADASKHRGAVIGLALVGPDGARMRVGVAA